MEDDRIIWLKEHFIKTLIEWKREIKTTEKKTIIPQPTFEGLLFTTFNFINLCERLLYSLEYVCLSWKFYPRYFRSVLWKPETTRSAFSKS
uniref:Uncharacterized protein n=2 Tax=Ciona intestinalis TaxID=7719 RepID=F6Z1Q3_CIOIN